MAGQRRYQEMMSKKGNKMYEHASYSDMAWQHELFQWYTSLKYMKYSSIDHIGSIDLTDIHTE